MSSIFSGADHIDHVATQLPYAITVAVVVLSMYILYGAFRISPAILIPMGMVLLLLLQKLLHVGYLRGLKVSES